MVNKDDENLMTDDWDWEVTNETCPKCYAKLFFADDPESDTWEGTGVYLCKKCGFETSEAFFKGMDGGDWEFDDDCE